jgi:NAD+ synthase (glutamine-hydrolysing)
MLDRAEYKRRQAPPGVRVTSKAFGRDRRMPITNRFDGRVRAQVSAL